jgi:hypothetical protein
MPKKSSNFALEKTNREYFNGKSKNHIKIYSEWNKTLSTDFGTRKST